MCEQMPKQERDIPDHKTIKSFFKSLEGIFPSACNRDYLLPYQTEILAPG